MLPVSLSLIALLAVCGPWSGYSVSVLSQNLRFEKILAEHDLLKDGALIAPTGTIPETGQREISSIILYFDRNHDLDRLRALPRGAGIDDLEKLLGFTLQPYPDYPGREEIYFSHNLRQEYMVPPIADFDYFTVISVRFKEMTAPGGLVTAAYSRKINSCKSVAAQSSTADVADCDLLHREQRHSPGPEELTQRSAKRAVGAPSF